MRNLCLTILLTLFGFICYNQLILNNHELNSKYEWSNLQDFAENRIPKYIDSQFGIIMENDEPKVIVIKAIDGVNIFILMNSDYYPYIKIYPKLKKFKLRADQYKYIVKKYSINSDVDTLLKLATEFN